MLPRLRALFRRRLPPPPTIVLTATGFEVRDSDVAAVGAAWAEVRRVLSYKRDVYAADCIMLAFECAGPAPTLVPSRWIEVAEHWPGFGDLLGAMEPALRVSPNWYIEIMTPAFEPTPRLLYEQASDTAGRDAPAA